MTTDQRLEQRFRLTVPEGDHLERAICDHCGFIDYHNPRVVVGALPIFENQILLARRAIEPRRGYWTVPGGFMEKGESLQQGAARETWEECLARIEVGPLLGMFTVPHIAQVQVFFYADVPDGKAEAGPESLEVRWFAFDDIPWDDYSFPASKKTIAHYLRLKDRPQSTWVPRVETLEPVSPREAL